MSDLNELQAPSLESHGPFRFDRKDLFKYAAGTLDFNPLHTDEMYAFDYADGRLVVFGCLLATLVLVVIDKNYPEIRRHERIYFRFMNPLSVNDSFFIFIDHSVDKINFEVVLDNGVKILVGTIEFSSDSFGIYRDSHKLRGLVESSREGIDFPQFAEFDILKSLFLDYDMRPKSRLFALLASISRFAGMEDPGEQSLISSIEIIRKDNDTLDRFSTGRIIDEKNNEQLSYSKKFFNTQSFLGFVETFARKVPRSFEDWFAKSSDFALESMKSEMRLTGECVAIFGGSKGLGALFASMVLRFGGIPIIFARTKPKCSDSLMAALHFYPCELNSEESIEEAISVMKAKNIKMVAWFVSPRIFGKKPTGFDPLIFNNFRKYYYIKLKRVLTECQGLVESVFYPSSVLVENKQENFVEYSEAKRLSELDLKSDFSQIKFVIPRLPHIQTSQTASILEGPEDFSIFIRSIEDFFKRD